MRGAQSVEEQQIKPRKKVLFISTYKTACGIGTFTETLETHLSEKYDVEIGVLDQYVLKGTDPRLEKAGDALIEEIISRAKTADIVNLQWEPGLLGGTKKQILRRFEKILQSAKNVVVTVHTVIPEEKLSILTLARMLKHRHFSSAVRYIAENVQGYGRKTYQLLEAASNQSENFQLIVHTPREVRFFKEAIGIKSVSAHPLSYIRKGWEDLLEKRAAEIKESFESEYGIDKKFIGFFGFLSDYKGVTTSIEAMRTLPDHYHLMLFGGVHPALIRDGEQVSPYVKQLMATVHPENTTSRQKKSLLQRVHFLGAPDDFDFAAAIKACDINVFPYVEIGQSASGPVSQSVELCKRTIVSSNKMFNQLEKYFPKRMVKVDVGNHLQLSQSILREIVKEEPKKDSLKYNNETLAAFYSDVFEKASAR